MQIGNPDPGTAGRPVRRARRWHRGLGGVLIAALLSTAWGGAGGPSEPPGRLQTVVAFADPRPTGVATDLPEGVAVDRRGDIYATLGPPFFTGGGYGAVVRLGRDGGYETLVEFPDGPAPAGVVVDARRRVYVAVPDPGGPDAGVYRVGREGSATRIAGTEGMAVPNGLALGHRGALFVSDSLLGQIWRIPWRERVGRDTTGRAGPWLSHPLLAGCEAGQVGANGIAVRRGQVYVANSERGLLLRVPIRPDGAAGTPIIVAGDEDCKGGDDLYGLDGIAVDRTGTVYATLVLQNRLVRIEGRTGAVVTLLDADDGLWNPASVALDPTRRRGSRLLLTNYAVLGPEPPSSLGPAVLSYRLRGRQPGW
ncbi:SMP-30/gluconolactonase/LRE family protein [Euzebya tangerina]|uniref:SMP-30/gluconolactonase/LRE family protein n=1 Tax=Euzebya tangerina TaxID=591198 RepID=UPI0013C317C5|nr:hypothetical protein [Euzebya tangerina]